ncbi:MAG: response regulator [Candidatus Brocadiales bacterium]|nr:response regulator [Candidatus Brocadiales bacterium]
MEPKTRKILIVDDTEEDLYLLETSLERSGYDIVSSRNGVEAIEKLKKNTVDMIVSDILMPGMDGFHLCRECKKDANLKKIPFVFYTATYTDEKDKEFALSLGAEKFIIKPCEINELLKTLKAVIEDYREAVPVASTISINNEETYLTKYNKRLVEKIEKKVLDLEKEIDKRKLAELKLKEQKKALNQKNIALNEILGQIEIEKKQIKDNVTTNVENLLLPLVQKLELRGESQKYIQLLKENIQELTSSFGTKLTEKEIKLTSREIEICGMIKNGLTNKEIVRLLHISQGTIERHRANIRKKLGIINKDINLSSFLKTL